MLEMAELGVGMAVDETSVDANAPSAVPTGAASAPLELATSDDEAPRKTKKAPTQRFFMELERTRCRDGVFTRPRRVDAVVTIPRESTCDGVIPRLEKKKIPASGHGHARRRPAAPPGGDGERGTGIHARGNLDLHRHARGACNRHLLARLKSRRHLDHARVLGVRPPGR